MARILIVEDDADTRDLVSRYLERFGHRTVPAANGWEALLAIDSRSFDLIVLDVMMPGLDGATFLKILRGSPEGRDTSVVVVTALEPDKVAPKVAPFGVAGILPKKEDLFATLPQAVAHCLHRGPAVRYDKERWELRN